MISLTITITETTILNGSKRELSYEIYSIKFVI